MMHLTIAVSSLKPQGSQNPKGSQNDPTKNHFYGSFQALVYFLYLVHYKRKKCNKISFFSFIVFA